MLKPTLTWAAALGLVLGLGSSTASAGTPLAGSRSCTLIKRLPYVITRSGDYCLAFSIATHIDTGRAIDVAANDVRLDLGGFEIDGRAGGPGSDAVGVWAVDRKNVTVKNGTLVGFDIGVGFFDSRDSGVSRGHVVDNVQVKGSHSAGINVTSRDAVIRNCVVTDTTGGGFAEGIRQKGAFGRITDNRVVDTRATGRRPSGFSAGIDLVDNQTRTVVGNRIDGVSGGASNFGIRCGDRFARLNQVRHAEVPFSVCTDAPYPYPYPSASPGPLPSPSPDPYPSPYPYPGSGSPHGPRGGHPPIRYGMAAMGVVMASVALLKRFMVV